MGRKLPKTVEEQIKLLSDGGMLFSNSDNAPNDNESISFNMPSLTTLLI
jgi:hypothetical protein